MLLHCAFYSWVCTPIKPKNWLLYRARKCTSLLQCQQMFQNNIYTIILFIVISLGHFCFIFSHVHLYSAIFNKFQQFLEILGKRSAKIGTLADVLNLHGTYFSKLLHQLCLVPIYYQTSHMLYVCMRCK